MKWEHSPSSLTPKGTHVSGPIETFSGRGEVAVSVRSLRIHANGRNSFRDCPIRPLSHLSVRTLCLKFRQDGVNEWLQRVDCRKRTVGTGIFQLVFFRAKSRYDDEMAA